LGKFDNPNLIKIIKFWRTPIMPAFKRFEEIQAWQKAREITKIIYSMSNNDIFAKDFSLRDQMKRASV